MHRASTAADEIKLARSKSSPTDLSVLARTRGDQWLAWFEPASAQLPELGRAMQCMASLESFKESLETAAELDVGLASQLAKPIFKFVGQAKCPSVQACDKLAFRVQVLTGWMLSTMDDFQDRSSAQAIVLHAVQGSLERLFVMAEGADDKYAVLTQAVRQLVKVWLDHVRSVAVEPPVQARWLYSTAMADGTGLVSAQWWWPAILQTDRNTIVFLAGQTIEGLSHMQPSMALTWKSYDKRWLRIRLKSMLTELQEWGLLSELMCKSALDDFEAAQALTMLAKAGCHRVAIAQGEKWLRLLPASPVLAEALLEIYLHDGWDEEAQALLAAQYQIDPHPKWLDLLKRHFGKSAF